MSNGKSSIDIAEENDDDKGTVQYRCGCQIGLQVRGERDENTVLRNIVVVNGKSR